MYVLSDLEAIKLDMGQRVQSLWIHHEDRSVCGLIRTLAFVESLMPWRIIDASIGVNQWVMNINRAIRLLVELVSCQDYF